MFGVVVVLVSVADNNVVASAADGVVSRPGGGGEFGDEIQQLKALYDKLQKMKHPAATKSHGVDGNSTDFAQPSSSEESGKAAEVLPNVEEVEIVHEDMMEIADVDDQPVVRYVYCVIVVVLVVVVVVAAALVAVVALADRYLLGISRLDNFTRGETFKSFTSL